MANTYEKILLAGLQASYNALPSKDANVLYFCTDTGKLYKGDVDFSNAIVVAAVKPVAPIEGKIYVLADTNTVEAYYDGAWHVLSYPMVSTVNEHSDNMHVASAKAVYNAITSAIKGVTGGTAIVKDVEAGTSDGKVKVTKGDGSSKEVTVPGVVTTPTWDATLRKLTLPVTGSTSIEVNIGKDTFLDPEADNKYNPETKNIELHLNDGTELIIPAADLVDVYTGGSTSSAKVAVGEDNIIKVNVVVDPVEGNALVLTNAGLKVDLSAYNTAVEVDAKVKVAKDAADAAQAQANTNKAAIATLNGNSTTSGSVAKAVADAVKSLKDNEIKAAATAAATADAKAVAADAKAESAHDAIDILNGSATQDGSVAKAVADAVKSLKENEIKAAADAAATADAKAVTADGKAVAAQSTADSALAKANANAEEIAALAAGFGWGTF